MVLSVRCTDALLERTRPMTINTAAEAIDAILADYTRRAAAPARKGGHSEACKAQDERRKAYQDKWPGYCRHCNGEGFKHFYSYNRYEQDSEQPCQHCYDGGICPRCGEAAVPADKPIWNDETGEWAKCEACGWDPHDPDICPDNECTCWDQE